MPTAKPRQLTATPRRFATALLAGLIAGVFALTGCAGLPDNGFGVGGIRLLPPATQPLNIRLVGGGKIMAVTSSADKSGHIYVFRLDPNGAVDTSYANHGVLTLPTGEISLGPEGRAYLYVHSSQPFQAGRLVAYTAAGKPDTGFGTNGHLSAIGAFAVSPAGQLYVQVPTTMKFARYSAGGVLDPTFSSTGGQYPVAFGPGGSVYFVDYLGGRGEVDSTLYKMTASGASDTTFGSAGHITLSSLQIGGLTIDSAGRLVMSVTSHGFYGTQLPIPAWVFRFTPAGKADRSFGWLGMEPLRGAVSGDSVVTDAAGRTLAIGSSESGHPVVYRLLANGQPDPTFGIGGRHELVTVTDANSFPPAFSRLAVDGLGHPVLGVVQGTTSALMRLTAR